MLFLLVKNLLTQMLIGVHETLLSKESLEETTVRYEGFSHADIWG